MDGVLEEDQRYFEAFNEPLFSSHMIDLSEEPVDVNIGICADYFGRMSAMNQWLEIVSEPSLFSTGLITTLLGDRGYWFGKRWDEP